MDGPVILYHPIAFDLKVGATSAEIHRLEMDYQVSLGSNMLKAYFSVAGNLKFVRIVFPHAEIFRVIDDMHLPFEETNLRTEGHISNHFAYQVEGSPFWASQRAAFETLLPGSIHFRFVTGGSCLDVISRDQPDISWALGVHE